MLLHPFRSELTLNQEVRGSRPWRPISKIRYLVVFGRVEIGGCDTFVTCGVFRRSGQAIQKVDRFLFVFLAEMGIPQGHGHRFMAQKNSAIDARTRPAMKLRGEPAQTQENRRDLRMAQDSGMFAQDPAPGSNKG